MVKVNDGYFNLTPVFFFRDVILKAAKIKKENPLAKVISLGVGDVTRHLPLAAVEAMQKAVAEMAEDKTMRGYGPEKGYDFLREAIAKNDYQDWGLDILPSEIFVSDGSKCDVANVQEIFSAEAVIGIPDPVYPVYRDSNIMAGRKIVYLPCLKEHNFMPEIPEEHLDIIYLCSPNNPTGTMMSREDLQKWVDYARAHHSVIIFDSAYKEFVVDKGAVRSIYEIAGAKEVAIETRSFSKTAGFTGMRCGYMVVPEALMGARGNGEETSLNQMWLRRTSTKFNGASYIIQRGAEAIFTPKGKEQVAEIISYYLGTAKIIREAMHKMGFVPYGGDNSPYIWTDITASGLSSAAFVDRVLSEAFVVSTPGSGFGKYGEGFVRFSALGNREDTVEALARIEKLFVK